MPKLQMWNPRKNKDYDFMDRNILEMFSIGGTAAYIHKYIGPVSSDGSATSETTIQDVLFLENRDRKYDENIYELMISYNLQDYEFDMRQFGMFVESDILYLEMHLNDTINRLGRKPMSGDVLELPHLREDTFLNPDTPAANKYYVIRDVMRAAGGYSPTWWPHLIRVKIAPLTNSQEFSQILDGEVSDVYGDPSGSGSGQTLADIISDYNNQIMISEELLDQAEKEVDRRNFETRQFYVVPGDECKNQYPWIFAGDGFPPNGAELAGTGDSFPDSPLEGQWFLRTDYEPAVLFKREGVMWRRKEVDYRKKWEAAHRILESYINNNNQTTVDGKTYQEKQTLRKLLKPRADF